MNGAQWIRCEGSGEPPVFGRFCAVCGQTMKVYADGENEPGHVSAHKFRRCDQHGYLRLGWRYWNRVDSQLPTDLYTGRPAGHVHHWNPAPANAAPFWRCDVCGLSVEVPPAEIQVVA